MIRRSLEPVVVNKARQFPVVLVTGPRQSGKTTLCRRVFADKPYFTLEAPDVRNRVRADPRGFLAEVPQGAVIDEIQNVPELLSYLQGEADDRPIPGRFILTGSQHFAISATVSQSLAGRVGLVELLPLSAAELRAAGLLRDVWSTVLRGGYPALYDRDLSPPDWFSGYVATYVERDVRQLINITNLTAFETFLSLTAARTATLLDLARLGSDAGVSQPTARHWFTALEASYIAFRLPPFFRNLGKRLVKTPKIHFFDSGLLCYLLGIRSAEQLRLHPLRGAIFETWVVSEVAKAYRNRGERAELTFFRDRHAAEVDMVAELGLQRCAVEVKSAATILSAEWKHLTAFAALSDAAEPHVKTAKVVVYAGDEGWQAADVNVLSWRDVASYVWPGLTGAEQHVNAAST